jgi:hypothetical protein
VTTPQKVGLVFGIGYCSIEFRFRAPSASTLVGAGGSTQALLLMLLSASDAMVDDQRAAVVVSGTAEKAGITKRFDWVFRSGYELEKCPAASGEGYTSVLTLQGGEAVSRTVLMQGEELFRRAPDDAAPLVFEPYAEADRDKNGTITFAELEAEPVTFHSEDDWSLPEDALEQRRPDNLLALLYRHLLPRIARMQGSGPCLAELRERGR